MIIYSGFWAGFISGVLVGIVAIAIISLIVSYKESSVNEKILDYINSLPEEEREEILKGGFDEGHN